MLLRLQWAWVIAWHILLPAFTVGVASYIAVLEGFYFFTNTLLYQPAKLVAIEGRYDTIQPTPLTLFGIHGDKAATFHDARSDSNRRDRSRSFCPFAIRLPISSTLLAIGFRPMNTAQRARRPFQTGLRLRPRRSPYDAG